MFALSNRLFATLTSIRRTHISLISFDLCFDRERSERSRFGSRAGIPCAHNARVEYAHAARFAIPCADLAHGITIARIIARDKRVNDSRARIPARKILWVSTQSISSDRFAMRIEMPAKLTWLASPGNGPTSVSIIVLVHRCDCRIERKESRDSGIIAHEFADLHAA